MCSVGEEVRRMFKSRINEGGREQGFFFSSVRGQLWEVKKINSFLQ